MSNAVVLKEDFNWIGELEKTVIQSLTTSFGLDFLLIKDKVGGDVDTVHNVRQGVYATEKEKKAYDNRGEYDSHKYHSHENYRKNNKKTSEAQKKGTLVDGYTGEKVDAHESIDLDHVVSANEIHNDPGRVLAELDGADLANKDENLVATNSAINRSKKADSMNAFLAKTAQKIDSKQKAVQAYREKLATLDPQNPAHKNEIETLNKKIENGERYIEKLQKINDALAKEKDEKARKTIDKEINKYYISDKFLKNTALQAAREGLKMGKRQALGLVLAELWFELKESIPQIYHTCKVEFTLERFLNEVSKTIINILKRLKVRFNDLIISFKDGVLAGIFSNLTKTCLNIFVTSTKMVGKLIREMWNSLVGVIKLIFFNPNNLLAGDLLKEALRLLGGGVSVLVGTMIHAQLETLQTFPFGSEIAAFLSALATGILNLGFVYFLEYSKLAQDVWAFLNRFSFNAKSDGLAEMKAINQELDSYLMELSKMEFNLLPDEVAVFSNALISTNNELERSFLLKAEIEKRNIQLPFESGNLDSVKNWLKHLQNNG